MEKYGTMENKLQYYGQNSGITDKTMVLYRELWNFDLQRKKTLQIIKNKKR